MTIRHVHALNSQNLPSQSPGSSSSSASISRLPRVVMLFALLALGLLLGACGPEAAASEDAQQSEMVRIAQEFAATQDMAAAQGALDAVEVPNPRQLLLLTTEEFVLDSQGRDPAAIAALVQLADALGLESATINEYAVANGLAEAPAAAEPLVVAVQPLAQPANVIAAPAAQAEEQQPPAQADAAPTDVPTEEPTATPDVPPTATPDTSPKAQIGSPLNVREGPGTTYNIVGGLQEGEVMPITGKNAAGDWWQIQMDGGITGWVYGPLVQAQGDTNSVALITDIPAPPEPVAQAPEPAPAEQAPAEEAAEPAEPAAQPDQPHFALVERRLWSKQENGGCAGQHLLRINVLDANGNRLNGVRLQGLYIKEIIVTGAQGKGDGIIEYDLHGSGEGFMVINDVDGREATSDRAEGFTTRSMDIDKDTLIAAGYCSDSADCDVFYSSFGCLGHHSWEATFKRNY